MGKNRKTYSTNFKKQVAVEAMDSKQTVAEIASKYDVSPSMVSTWKKAFINGEFSKDLKKARKDLEAMARERDEATIELGKARLEIALIKKKHNLKG